MRGGDGRRRKPREKQKRGDIVYIFGGVKKSLEGSSAKETHLCKTKKRTETGRPEAGENWPCDRNGGTGTKEGKIIIGAPKQTKANFQKKKLEKKEKTHQVGGQDLKRNKQIHLYYYSKNLGERQNLGRLGKKKRYIKGKGSRELRFSSSYRVPLGGKKKGTSTS